MGKKRRPTEEEYREKKPKILELFKQGYPMRRIQAMLDITQYYLKQIREELITEGAISREELKSAYDRYMAENPPAQGLNKTKVRVRSNTQRADARHARSIARKEKTFELVKQGKNVPTIARELQLSETAVMGYMSKLVEEGRLSKEEGCRKGDRSKPIKIDRDNPEYIAKRDEVVRLLGLGWRTGAIRKHLNITPYYINIYLRDIKYKKLISPEEIRKAKDEKKINDLKALEDIIQSGLPIDYFRETHPEFTYNEVTPLIKELIEAGKVSRDQIEKTARKTSRQRRSGTPRLSADEQIAFVTDKVKKGYSPQEILKSDKTKSLTMHKVLYQKRQIIAKGIISAEEAERLMRRRQARNCDKKHGKTMDRVKEYTMQGYSFKEIVDLIGYNYVYLSKMKTEYIRKNGWFSKEELKEFTKQRKIREYEALPQEEKDRIEKEKIAKLEAKKAVSLSKRIARKEKTCARHQELLALIKQYSLKGRTVAEIAEALNISKEHIYALQTESKKNGTWLSYKDLKKIKQKRLKRKEKAKQKRQEQKAIEVEKQKAEKIEQEKQRKQQELWTLRDLAVQGLNNKEIAEQMHYSIPKIMTLKKDAIERGIWFSENDLEFYKQQRIRREAIEEAARQIEEQKRLKQERIELEKAIKEKREQDRKIEAEKRKKIQEHEVEYKILRKRARYEDKLELDGEENVPFKYRKEFTDLLIKLAKIGASISDKDIEIVYNTIYMHTEFIEPKYLKFLIMQANKKGGIVNAERTVTSLMSELRETKYYKPLLEYKTYIKNQRLLSRIKQMKSQGMENALIADNLHISSADVAILLDAPTQKPELLEDEERGD